LSRKKYWTRVPALLALLSTALALTLTLSDHTVDNMTSRINDI